ncbi:MAG: DNA topoisomerase I [Nanoarchaeota archaeon]
MAYTLMITEKPSAAKKIADALADTKPIKKSENGVPYYILNHKKKEIVIVPAVGHLYGLDEVTKTKGFKYPVFDVHWIPIADIRKDAAYSRKYLNVIKKLAKKADDFCLSTDYDIEGETLGYNIVRFACGREDSKRMKFSTLTKEDLIFSYNHMMPRLDWGQANAGVTRHTLDWFYGINLSRALTSSITKSGMFKILSSGRVQGPALKILSEREKEIKEFIPEPFWQIELVGQVPQSAALRKCLTAECGLCISAWHEKDKFWDKAEAEKVMANVQGVKEAKVSNVDASQAKQRPPTPFDLTTLQTESYRCLNISPKNTLALAQNLYLAGVISYPRTSSQQLPEAIGYKDILSKLAKLKDYSELVKVVIKGKLIPNNGKKVDPAHPAIYPTGVLPKAIEGREAALYDLIVRRFLATFGEPAVRETVTIKLLAKGESFVTRGTRTITPGWHVLYGQHVKLEEEELPKVKENDKIAVQTITNHSKETQPPKRYTESSIIKELERRNLGTKATRAQIIDTLVQRNYVNGKPLEVTELGMRVMETLDKYCPKILDEALTRHFEEDMDKIREGSQKPEFILSEAKTVLTGILGDFKKHEKEVGNELQSTFEKTREAMSTMGTCMTCKTGILALRRGKFGWFIACNKYPDCKTTFSLPQSGLAKPTGKVCQHCQYPVILMIRKAKKPQEVCINPDCPAKKLENEEKAGTDCPKCKEGKLVLRKSVYGHFLACGRFPKCRFIEGRRGPRKKATDSDSEDVPSEPGLVMNE